jgi:hypothetical protein
MLFNIKKGSAVAYGGIFMIIILLSFFAIYIVSTGDVKRGIVTAEGRLISFVNDFELLTRTFNESIKFIASRAAYDLGKTAGLEHKQYWSSDYPKMDDLKNNLIEKIKDNLPVSYEEEEIKVTWGEANIDISNQDAYLCDSLEDSKCFFVQGTKYISVYDKSTDSIISLNFPINSKILSSYFKLLYIGREILENPKYNSLLNDVNRLSNILHSDFPGIDFTITAIILEDDIDDVDIIIKDYHCPADFHCLAPLKSEEPKGTWFSEDIPYDYISLHFKTKVEQTAFTDPDFDFSLTVSDGDGDDKEKIEVVCS